MSNETWDSVEHHIGRERLQHYLAAASGDTSVARALYDWNVEASSAFWGSLGHLEVALRNTVDARMTARHERLGREGHWIFDDQYEFGRREPPAAHQYPYVDVVRAKRRVMKNGKPVTPGLGQQSPRSCVVVPSSPDAVRVDPATTGCTQDP